MPSYSDGIHGIKAEQRLTVILLCASTVLCAVAPDDPTSPAWSTEFTAWPSLACSNAPCRFYVSRIGWLTGMGTGSGSTSCIATFAGNALSAAQRAVTGTLNYVVPGTRYRWQPSTAYGSMPSGLVYAGTQDNGVQLYVCRAVTNRGVLQAGKTNGDYCWFMEVKDSGQQFESALARGRFDYLRFV